MYISVVFLCVLLMYRCSPIKHIKLLLKSENVYQHKERKKKCLVYFAQEIFIRQEQMMKQITEKSVNK